MCALAPADVLLVGPKTNLKSTWVKFLTEKLGHYTVCLSLDEYLDHKKEWETARGDTPCPVVLLLNPEAVTPIVAKLRKIKWDMIIWDEAQRLKNRTSRSSRDAALLAKCDAFKLALSGTPMDFDPKDMWAIMRFVNVDALGDVWKDFEEEYLVKPTIDLSKKMGMIQRHKMMLAYQIAKRKAPMREDKIKKFAKKLYKHVMRISKEDAGIEGAKVTELFFNMEGKQLRKYMQLEKTMIVKHKGQVIKTPLKITQLGKLQQMTGGHIKDEDGEEHLIGDGKRKLLMRSIRKYADDEPFVVFCKFVWEVHMIADLMKRMGYFHVAKLWGKVKDVKNDPRRTNMLLDFQKGKYDIMVCQQKTGGVGVDLYFARKAFVYSMGHSYIDYDQMLSRLDFLDQDERAEFFLLMANNSVDMDIAVSVKKKMSITKSFFDRLNRRD